MSKDTLFFSNQLISWYISNKRDLPWRKIKDPYRIWLSEIILQQTRVAQGLPYYKKFIENYPSITELANASIDEVLLLWQGLGYYSRARNLHATAQYIAFERNGVFPTTYKELIKLKGVGDYTASAIASFAYAIPEAVVDGNVYRFLSRYFGVEEELPSSKAHRVFKDLAFSLMDKDKPDVFNQAIMEFGALQCTPKGPDCGTCIFSNSCYAYSKDKVFDFPNKKSKTKIRKRYFNYFIIQNDKNEIAISQRLDKDIWFKLFELPLLESSTALDFNGLKDKLDTSSLFESLNLDSLSLFQTNPVAHKLSHQHLYAQFWLIKANLKDKGVIWIPYSDLENYAFPVLLTEFFKSFQLLNVKID